MRYIQKGVGCPWRRFLWRSFSLTLFQINDLNWFWYVPFKYIPWYGLEWVLVSQRANYTRQGISLISWWSFSPFHFYLHKKWGIAGRQNDNSPMRSIWHSYISVDPVQSPKLYLFCFDQPEYQCRIFRF